jgi:endogenous inhibitor of DNA gyrase (YacG/DUF329 family)
MFPNPGNEIAKTCPICWEAFIAAGRQAGSRVYCSPQCKRTAAARREVERASNQATPFRPLSTAPAPTPPPAPLPQLAAQRECPHCGGPVSIVALLTTPEAARPQMPIAAPDRVIPLHR